MNAHYFQHVPFENIGSIERWFRARSARVSATKFYQQCRLPNINDVDWLIVMGGPMSVNDEGTYGWLPAEKAFIAEAIARDRIVLGVCLGAQLIASALGAAVFPNPEREIGWFPIQRTADPEHIGLARALPAEAEVFHWHGETFDLPAGAVRIARSAACDNQAFSIGQRIVGLQFHLETTPAGARALIENCRHEIVPGHFVQSENQILASPDRFARINAILDRVLDQLACGGGA